MRFTRQAVALAGLLFALGWSGSAAAEDDWRFTIGAKLWYQNWSTWVNTGSTTSVGQTETGYESVIIPSVNIRYKDFFVSGDWYPNTTFDFVTAYRGVEREEFSLVAGYYIVPQLAAAVGWKRVHQKFGSTFDMNIDVPMLGLQAGAPIGKDGDWFIYGNGFFGPINVSTTSGQATNYDGWYYSTELGLGVRVADHISLTLGYKYQTIRWEEIVKTATASIPGYDLTSGWIFGVAFSF